MKSLLQTQQWANLKVSQGWHSHEFEGIFVLEKKLPFGKTFLYAPEVSWENVEKKLENFTNNFQNSQSIFFRLEILDEFEEKIIEKLKENGFIKAFEELQPEWRHIIDISKSEDEILAGMKQKGRYNIKIAQKHGVKVERIAEENLLEGVDAFYNLFLETSKNQGFSVRPKEYFRDLILRLYPNGLADLFIAKFNEVPVSGLIITYFDGVASYLYGASSAEYRNVMAPYLMHFEAIKKAKEKGCKAYDLLAVAPAGASENHKYAGITRFKEQFGGEKVHIIGSYDLVYKPFWYKMFKMAEKYRRH